MTMELHCEVHEGSGPYLLMVHGFLSSRAQWSPNLAALSEVCRPVVIELWGHGRSPAPAERGPYEPEGYMEVFEGIREGLGVARWWICGMSLGSTLTLRYALTRSDRILGHVFSNTNSGLSDASWTANRKRLGLEAGDRVEREGPTSVEEIEVHPKHARNLSPELYAVLCADAELHDHIGIANTLRYTNPDTLIRDRLGSNRVPTLLVSGEREKRFPPIRAYVEEHMPELTIARTEGGHAPNLDVPDAWNAAVVEFISKHPGA